MSRRRMVELLRGCLRLVIPVTLASVLVGPGASGQDPPPVTQDTKPPTVENLAARYRLTERYATSTTKSPPGALNAYRVAFRETIRVTTDAAKGGAPERTEYLRQAIWTERVAQISSIEFTKVAAVVRRYDKVKITPDPRPNPGESPLLAGLDLWVRPQATGFPQLLSLTPGRGLSVEEYRFLVMNLYVPDLAALLPLSAVHLGDSWRLPRTAVQNVVTGGVSGPGSLVAKLSEILPGQDGKKIAVITITGQVPTSLGDSDVNARAEFVFETPAPTTETPRPVAAADVVEARGAVVKLSVSQEDRRVPVGDDPRRKQDLRRELVFERQLGVPEDSLAVPKETPKPTLENSWLLYVDPKEKYHARFPQDMNTGSAIGPNTFMIQRRRPDGGDQIRINITPDAQPKPDDFVKDVAARWAELKIQALSGGPPQALPDVDWPGRKVYRNEAVLRMTNPPPNIIGRIYFHGYVVQTGGKGGLTVEASTTLDPPAPFREQVEAMIKSFRFGPPEKSAAGAPRPTASLPP